jgi:hypothetical protein
MKQYNNLTEMQADENLSKIVYDCQKSMVDEWRKSMPGHLFLNWNTELGGYTYVIETENELKKVLEKVPALNGEYQFDSCQAIGDGSWVHFFVAVNNAGGPQYYCPLELIKQIGSSLATDGGENVGGTNVSGDGENEQDGSTDNSGTIN